MSTTLTTEQEKVLREHAEALGYESPEACVADGLRAIHEMDQDLSENGEEISRLIDEGFDSIDRGELLTADEAKAYIAAKKQEFMSKRSAA